MLQADPLLSDLLRRLLSVLAATDLCRHSSWKTVAHLAILLLVDILIISNERVRNILIATSLKKQKHNQGIPMDTVEKVMVVTGSFQPGTCFYLFLFIIFSLSCILHYFFKLPLKSILTCFFVVLGKYLSWTLPTHVKFVTQQRWWHSPLISALGEQRHVDLWIQG